MKTTKYILAGILSISALAFAKNSSGVDFKVRTKMSDSRDNPIPRPTNPDQPVNPIAPSPDDPNQPVNPIAPSPDDPSRDAHPTPPISDKPFPPNEIVKMNIQFERTICSNLGDSATCAINGIVRGDQSITLQSYLYLCADPNDPGYDPTNPNCPFNGVIREGYWIDLGHSHQSQRLIGIITIKKWNQKMGPAKGAPNERSWYDIEVEVIGKNKVLAKMIGQLSSWEQLQPVKLLVEESESNGSSGRTYLKFGPALFPAPNAARLAKRSALEPIQWKVIKGSIIP